MTRSNAPGPDFTLGQGAGVISCMIKGGHAIRTGLLRARKAGQLHPLLAVEAIFSVVGDFYFHGPSVGDSGGSLWAAGR